MSTVISSCAYIKMLLHAAKYPHCAVNGLLLADSKDNSANPSVVDAVPLFHMSLNLIPMSEVALVQVEEAAATKNQKIIGYYCASENFNSNTIDKAPGLKIAAKICEYVPNAVFVMIDNRLIVNETQPALHLWSMTDGRWQSVEKYSVEQKVNTLEATSSLIERGASKELIDFDNYLDNPSDADWENEHLNRDINKILAMY